jgi:hypothetical protein
MLRFPACVLFLIAPLACESKTAPGDSLTISPAGVELLVGATYQFSVIGAAGASWSSSNTSVATVVPQTGFVQAVGRGTALITATSGSASATAQVVVLAPASLALSDPALTFQALLGAASPAAQSLSVSNAGDGSIANLAVGAVSWGEGEPTGWLSAGISASTTPALLTITPDISSLPRGTYTATVPVLAPGIDNSPQHVAVTLDVLMPASIEVSRNSVPIAGIPGEVPEETVTVSNGGDVPLTDLGTSVTYDGAPGQTWLSASLELPARRADAAIAGAIAAATEVATLVLAANLNAIQPGNYTATVRITTTTAGVAPRDIAVQLTVNPGPAILVAANVALNATLGTDPQATPVPVNNGGGGTLSALSLGSVVYSGSPPVAWLNPVLSGATAPAVITLHVTSVALPLGVYTATIPVQSGVATNSPRNVVVTLTVGLAPTIVFSEAVVTFEGIPGTVHNKVIDITSSSAVQLTGLSPAINYTSGPSPGWLAASLQPGTSPASLTLTAETAGLVPGAYSATVTVSSTLANVAPRIVSVQLTVTPGPAIQFSTNPVVVSATFGMNPAPEMVTISNGGGGTLTGLSLGDPVYGAGATGWLNRSLSGNIITLTLLSSALATGNYTVTLPVLSPVASNSPANLVVNLTVGAAPVISVNPASAAFAGWRDAVSLPGQLELPVTNSGGGTLSGLTATIQYISGSAWLMAELNAMDAPTNLVLRPSTTALLGGTYSATVTISSSIAGVASRVVDVTYKVQTFTIDVFPFFKPPFASCQSCHSATAPVIASGTTASQYFANLGSRVIPFNASGSVLVCEIFTTPGCSHGGGKYNGVVNFSAMVTAWINSGALFR